MNNPMNWLGLMMGFVMTGALGLGSAGCLMSSRDDTNGIAIDPPLYQPQDDPPGGGNNGCPSLTDAQFMTYYNATQALGDGNGDVRQWADDAYVTHNSWSDVLRYLVRVSSQSDLYSNAAADTLVGEHQLVNINEAFFAAPSSMKLVVGAEVAGFINNQSGVHVAMLHPEANTIIGGALSSTDPNNAIPASLRWKQTPTVSDEDAYKWEVGIRMKVVNIGGVNKPVRAAWVELDKWYARCPSVPTSEIKEAIKKRMCGADPTLCEFSYVFDADVECQVPNSSELWWVECTHLASTLEERFDTGPALVTMIPDSAWPDQYDLPSGCSAE